MKKQNQIRKNSRVARSVAQPKAATGRSRVRVRMPAFLSRAVMKKAKHEHLSFSQFAERAIRKELRSSGRYPVIPKRWKEVASIDFGGYLDRDCEERIIYKTTEGNLKAVRSAPPGQPTIEDVSREQVARWIHQCVIPEEFEKDFIAVPPGKNEPLSKGL